jgi:hypothetical protein
MLKKVRDKIEQHLSLADVAHRLQVIEILEKSDFLRQKR